MPEAAKIRTVLDPASGPLAREYVSALLTILADNPAAEDFAAELEAVLSMLDREATFEDLLVKAPLSQTQRMELVNKVFRGRVGETLMGLLSVLVKHERLGLLRMIAQTFGQLLDHRMGKVPVTVTAAVPLDDSQRQQVEQALREALSATPVLKMNVDEKLLGGMVIRVGDRVYDASIRSQLDRMRQALMNQASRQVNV